MDNPNLVSYLLEFAMLIPAAIIALMPTRKHLRYRAGISCAITFGCVVIFGVLGAFVTSSLALPTNAVLLPESLLLLVLFCNVSTLQLAKRIYCFLNAWMLCSFATMYTYYVVAPWEISNINPVFTVYSAGMNLLVGFLICAIFARTLLVKLPALFENESIDSLWKWVLLAPLAMTALILWITPVSAANIMVGFLRPKGLATMAIIPLSIWFLYHVAWLVSSRSSDHERLRRENELLKLERKRQEELMTYIEDTRAMRHDFRHHMVVISELTHAGQASEVASYADQFIETSAELHGNAYCDNSAVDALAAHYDAIAKAKGIDTAWTLDLPGELPVKEIDFCSALGNLVENAINAAAMCDKGARTLSVKGSTFSGNIITLIVENSFTGDLKVSENGLPQTDRAGHGIGLSSVSAVARKYGGSLTTTHEDATFSASMLLYARKDTSNA